MLQYKIEILGDANGEIGYSISFQSDGHKPETKKFNSADIARIHSTVDKLAEALKQIDKPDENESLKTVRDALLEARYQLSTMNGLVVADGAAPEDTFTIDNSEIDKRINAAVSILDELEHTRSPDCP